MMRLSDKKTPFKHVNMAQFSASARRVPTAILSGPCMLIGCGWTKARGLPSGHLNLCRQNVVEYRKTVVTGDELRGCATEEESHDRLEMLLNLMPRTGVFWTGITPPQESAWTTAATGWQWCRNC
jgi:hypothetical protein